MPRRVGKTGRQPRSDLQELVQPLPALLPGAGLLPDRAVRPQPRRPEQRAALPGSRRDWTTGAPIATSLAQRVGVSPAVRREVPQRLRARRSWRTAGPVGRTSGHGWTDWYEDVKLHERVGRGGRRYSSCGGPFNVNGALDRAQAAVTTWATSSGAGSGGRGGSPAVGAQASSTSPTARRTTGLRMRAVASPSWARWGRTGSWRTFEAGPAGGCAGRSTVVDRAPGCPAAGGPSERDVPDKPTDVREPPRPTAASGRPTASSPGSGPRPSRDGPRRSTTDPQLEPTGECSGPSSSSPPTTATSWASTASASEVPSPTSLR